LPSVVVISIHQWSDFNSNYYITVIVYILKFPSINGLILTAYRVDLEHIKQEYFHPSMV